MFLSEHRAKEILGQHGVVIPEGETAESAEEAERIAKGLACSRYAVKAQIPAGGRGLAGGVRMAATPGEVRRMARALLGTRLVTVQTGPAGERVDQVRVEAAVTARRNFYLAVAIDERSAAPVVLGAGEGGVEFETKMRESPNLLESCELPLDGSAEADGIDGFLACLGVDGAAAAGLRSLIGRVSRAALESDALLVEINPLALTAGDEWIAVDAKIVLDGNALFRHPEFEPLVYEANRDERERIARENEINFLKMQGDIGLVVNGAGLGLATTDMVIEAGGRPANFMDIRTTATSFQIAGGVRLLLNDPAVKVILVNVHGGGMTVCDTIAEGINFAYMRAKRRLPIVFRAAGQNADWAQTIMRDRHLPFEACDGISEAVQRAVAIAAGRKKR